MSQIPLILTIDDDSNFLEILRLRLEEAGFHVETAQSANEGFEKAISLHPDLILLDIEMPGTRGTDALIDFKTDLRTKNIKIAFLTNLASPWPVLSRDKEGNESVAEQLGASDFLDKASDLDLIGEKVKAIMAK